MLWLTGAIHTTDAPQSAYVPPAKVALFAAESSGLATSILDTIPLVICLEVWYDMSYGKNEYETVLQPPVTEFLADD